MEFGLPTFSALLCQRSQRLLQAVDNPPHNRVVEFLGCIPGRMVVGIAIERRVGDHDGAIALSPERDMVAPCDAGNEFERGERFGREIRMDAESINELLERPARAYVGHKSEEVATV